MSEMPEVSGRFKWVLKVSLAALYVSLILLALKMIVVATAAVIFLLDVPYWSGHLHAPEFLSAAPWIVPVAATLALLGLAMCGLWMIVLIGLVRAAISGESALHDAQRRLRTMETLLEDQGDSLKKIADMASLSDQAKSLLYRDREIDALRELMQADIIKQDYTSALALVDILEKQYGRALEAANLRKDIESNRKASMQEKLDAALKRIQEIVDRLDWARALREAQRLVQLFPDNTKVAHLPKLVESARNKHKRSLLQEYGEAVRKNDVDASIELLKELDRYLTPQEGAALAESARGVFRAKLHSLGVQFAIQVADERWTEALATGEQIITEFPNTRIAQEVREKVDLLKARSATQQGQK